MTQLYPKDSLEDLILRGYRFREAARMCNMGRGLGMAYQAQVREALSKINRIEYLALRMTADRTEEDILAALSRWGSMDIIPGEFAELLGFSFQVPMRELCPDQLFDLADYGDEWRAANEKRHGERCRRAREGRRRGMVEKVAAVPV